MEWVTFKENSDHYQNNLAKKIYGNECRLSSNLNDNIVKEIFYAKGTFTEIGEKFNISRRHVSNIKAKKRWKHITKDL